MTISALCVLQLPLLEGYTVSYYIVLAALVAACIAAIALFKIWPANAPRYKGEAKKSMRRGTGDLPKNGGFGRR